MNKLLTIGTLGAAGVVGAGLLTIPGIALTGGTDDAAAKREDGVAELVLVDDEDEDDTADRSRTRDSRNSRASKVTQDTSSRASRGERAPSAGAGKQGAVQDVTTSRASRASRDSRNGDVGNATGTVRQEPAPRDHTGSNVTNDGPSNDTRSRDLSQDSNDVSSDSRDVSDDSND